MSDDVEMDAIDYRILSVLARDGRVSMTSLGSAVGLSKTPVALRVKRLEKLGVITGYRAELSARKLGLELVAFVEVKLADTREAALTDFNTAVRAIAEIETCHMIAGGFDYLIKVRARSISDYRRVLGEKLSGLPHVASTSTYVSMESVVDSSPALV
ncbi:MAG: Lrp/AsnC ligand binding domain-containing protein [Pseudomonadota bacterium]